MFGKITLFEHLVRQVWQMNKSVKRVLNVIINLGDFSLANC